jgi:hypothetical protein
LSGEGRQYPRGCGGGGFCVLGNIVYRWGIGGRTKSARSCGLEDDTNRRNSRTVGRGHHGDSTLNFQGHCLVNCLQDGVGAVEPRFSPTIWVGSQFSRWHGIPASPVMTSQSPREFFDLCSVDLAHVASPASARKPSISITRSGGTWFPPKNQTMPPFRPLGSDKRPRMHFLALSRKKGDPAIANFW